MNVSRRDVLKVSAASAVAGWIPTCFGQARLPVVGQHMDHYYEVVHDWLRPPKGMAFGDTHGLATDAKGRIYLAHTVNGASERNEAIVVYSPKGEFIEAWGPQFKGGAHGLDIRKEGNEEFVYHCDVNRRRIAKTDLHGRVVWEYGAPKEAKVYENENSWNPTNVAFAPNGDFFVGDGYGKSYVLRYTKEGKCLGVVIEPGSEKGKVNSPHGLWVDSRDGTPKLAIADRGNRRIQYFTLDGKHIKFLTEGMRLPCHIHFKGDLMLVPDLESVVTVLDGNDKVIASLGDGAPSGLRGAPRDQFKPGKFVHPHSSIWINDRDIVVAEWVPIGRVTLLRKL